MSDIEEQSARLPIPVSVLHIAEKTALGDAFGFCAEYAPEPWVREWLTRCQGYEKNPRPKHTGEPGHYSDDTQRLLGNIDVLVSGDPLTAVAFADSYVKRFKDDERPGYARGYFGLLQEVQSGSELIQRLGPAKSDKSGGAMGAVVCGIYPSIAEVIEVATLQARITHNTVDGVNAACAAALMGHYFIYDLGPKSGLGKFLEQHVQGEHCDWAQPWQGAIGEKGWESVHAAVTAIEQHDTLWGILRACVAFSGDVDTAAAIALGAASACQSVQDDLPEWLTTGLEQSKYGLQHLREQDRKLTARMKQLRKELQRRVSQAQYQQAGRQDTQATAIASDDVEKASTPALRVVAIIDPGHMFDAGTVQEHLQVPETMDLAAEANLWFAAGGDQRCKFSQFLLGRGATKFTVDNFVIPYQ